MSKYEMTVGQPIKEIKHIKLNHISLEENIDYVVLDDKKTIRFVSDKAKKTCDLFSNQEQIIADYKVVDYKNTYHKLYSNIAKLLIENRQCNWSPDILLMEWDVIRMYVSYLGDD
jgi:hypothetical protein